MSPAARKWAAIGGAGVLVLAGLGLVIARPWDTTPKTCAEAVSALAGGSADQQTLAAITETCRSLDEFAAEAAKYPESFAIDALASGVASLCEQVPGAASRPLCVEAAAAQPADPSASPAPQGLTPTARARGAATRPWRASHLPAAGAEACARSRPAGAARRSQLDAGRVAQPLTGPGRARGRARRPAPWLELVVLLA